jgi:tetratricopeptide (TPR) repeat protein
MAQSDTKMAQEGNDPGSKPIDLTALFDQAVALFQAARLVDAEGVIRQLLQTEPEHFRALHLLGIVLSQQGNHGEGLQVIDAALKIDAQSAAACNSRGNVLAGLKRFDEALASFETAIALYPNSAVTFSNRGNAYRELGRFDEAIASYDTAIALDSHDAEAFYNRGSALQELKLFDEAVASYDKAIALKSDYAEAFSNRGTALQALGQYSEAVTSYNRAIALRPNLAEALCSRGTAFQKMKRFDEAIASYNEAIAVKPDCAEAFFNRGCLLDELKRFEEALASCDQAIALKPDFAEAFCSRGTVLTKLQRFNEAVASYDQAIALKPDFAQAFGKRGFALLVLGRLEEATESFERAAALAPADVGYHLNLIVSQRVAAADPHFAAIKELAREEQSLEVDARILLHFGLGKAFADIGDPKQSFHHLLKGNSLKRQQINYDAAKTLALFDRIRVVFTAELIGERRGLGDPSRVPVFIVGMPRSGTTLVEQILASHPSVFGAGELDAFDHLAAMIRAPDRREFPETVATISGAMLHALGGKFLQMIRQMAPAAERITDKTPANFCYVGLIQLALPNARIIHVRRDPRDTAFSCFSILFEDDHLPFTYDLPELGRYIRAYQALMEHWRKVLLPGVMLEVQYEEIVNDLAAQARRIIAHCGLPWDDACLQFHRTKRAVRTASAAQVRQPIYRSSIGRWRDYEDLLQPLLGELEA